ncbi:helix-turn-helix domain-containing protein [Curvivirga sp.]|uniref:helix-turn-helix domain-containing protein n=1 Tax=Curvivirga sp. TaxID=2856848 RepID=UPI003B5B3658
MYKSIDISEVSKQAGIPASTLRYYEEKGLVQSIGRRGMKRLFDTSILNKLNFIALGQRAGFSLDEIADMFTHQGILQIDRSQLMSKADEVDKQIKELKAVRDGLRHAANCDAPSHLECPKFQRLMKAAGKANKREKRA